MIRNILEYLERSENKFPDKTAFADEGASCTYAELKIDRKSTRLNSSHSQQSRMPSSA